MTTHMDQPAHSTLSPTAPPARLPITPGGKLPRLQEAGLLLVIIAIGVLLTSFGGTVNVGGEPVNNFLRSANLLGGVATPMSVYAIMAVGLTCVIIAGGIDISVGAIFALSALGTAAVLQNFAEDSPAWRTIPTAVLVSCGIGVVCGLANGLLVVGLRVHPFIVTL